MTDLRKAAEMALEALKDTHYRIIDAGLLDQDLLDRNFTVATALRQALAEPANSTTNLVEPKASSQTEQGPPANKYNEKQIAWELERTALDDGYYGNALYVAMDMPQTTKSDKEMLHRYMCGSNLKTDHIKLQELAMRIYTASPKKEWVGLTREDKDDLVYALPDFYSMEDVIKATEAKLKEKNT